MYNFISKFYKHNSISWTNTHYCLAQLPLSEELPAHESRTVNEEWITKHRPMGKLTADGFTQATGNQVINNYPCPKFSSVRTNIFSCSNFFIVLTQLLRIHWHIKELGKIKTTTRKLTQCSVKQCSTGCVKVLLTTILKCKNCQCVSVAAEPSSKRGL